MNSVIKAPFIIFDESDSYLDWDNSIRFLNFVKTKLIYNTQILIITHKKEIFENMNSMIGVTFEEMNSSSRSFSLDLR